ncbi:MAG TPA: DUF3891 family protein [Thermoleophilaceae bacterium]
MLIRQEPDGSFLAIGQASHAWLSGQLARAWGNERFGAVEPWEEVCLGAEQHDVGWALWDLDPAIDPDTGRPHSFISLPIAEKIALWSEAPRHMLSQSRYAALLVSMHGSALYERFPPHDPDGLRIVERFLDEQRAFQARHSGGLDADQLRRNQKLVFAWDYISLALCLDWAPATVEDVPSAGEPVTLELAEDGELDPWPFRDERVELQAEARRLEGRFEDAPPVTLAFTLRPRR